ncbi:MAG: tRNA (N(6)-L-threonylcarbamoyladenosine(37)-C(2))-methylthiotransferase MtaB [Acidobacteriota bacterium]
MKKEAPERRKFFVATFGCRTNQADSAAIREDFLNGNYEETEDCSEADVIVINSCTVTHRSDQQVRQLTRKLHRESPRARLVVTGCYAQRSPQALARIPGVSAVVGNTRKREVLSIVSAPTHEEIAAIYLDDFRKARAIDLTPATQLGGRTRPFVKIQDGCDAKCTYCIIPAVRGPSRSVPPGKILEQVRALVAGGFREIVLTGIHIGTYGLYLQPRHSLDRLMAEIIQIEGLERVRLSSIEPMELSRRIIDLACQSEKIAPHFHICLQSGSDRVLKMMLRPYATARFADIVQQIRQRIPHAGIGTDVIVGFPGETDQDHQETVEFTRRMPFTYLHVFPYSDRSGTSAAKMKGKVAARTIKDRSRELRRISEEKNRAFRRQFLGKPLSVLTLSEEKDGHRTAISGNYLRAKLPVQFPPNQIVERIVRAEEGDHLLL